MPCQPPLKPDSGKLAPRQVAAQHERGRARDVALERQRHQVVHQPEVHVLALRQPERHVGAGSFTELSIAISDAPLELADVLDVGVEPRLVAGAEAAS